MPASRHTQITRRRSEPNILYGGIDTTWTHPREEARIVEYLRATLLRAEQQIPDGAPALKMSARWTLRSL
jgi:hypothetical protein